MQSVQRLLLCVFFAQFSGCGSQLATPANVLQWSLGPEHLATPPTLDDRIVLVPKPQPKPQPSTPSKPQSSESTDSSLLSDATVVSPCLHATSILPGPARDGRIFLLADGALLAIQPGQEAPRRLGEVAATSLLAYRETENGLEILASFGEGGATKLLSLTVDPSGVVHPTPTSIRTDTAELFHKSYVVPRCHDGGSECVRLGNDGEHTYLESWSVHNRSTSTLGNLDNAVDAAFKPDDASKLYVLVPCK